MFGTVTLNPCLDKMVTIPKFQVGKLNRIKTSRLDVAGKGNNAAVVYKNLGGEPFCTGINYIDNGSIIEKFLDRKKIPNDFLTVPGDVRINLKIFDESTQVVTEVNAGGYPVPNGCEDELLKKLTSLSKNFDTMLLGGSVPVGLNKDIYGKIIDAVRPNNVKIILDADGELFANGVKHIPFMIKPNDYELELYTGKKSQSIQEMARIGRDEFIDMGIAIVCISLGKDGAILLDENNAIYAEGMKVDVKGTAGAGDSVVSGIIYAVENNASLEDMLRSGVAAATSSVVKEGTKLCDRMGYDKYFKMVKIEKLNI